MCWGTQFTVSMAILSSLAGGGGQIREFVRVLYVVWCARVQRANRCSRLHGAVRLPLREVDHRQDTSVRAARAHLWRGAIGPESRGEPYSVIETGLPLAPYRLGP